MREKMAVLITAIPATLGAVLLFFALIFQFLFWCYKIETGAIAKIQQFATWSASVAVVGHVINAYKVYSFASANSDPWCVVEAVTSCFGELALVLWQVCAACTVFLSMRPEWIKKREKRQWIYLIFHFMVWTPSLLTTAIPLSYGILGANSDAGGSSGNYWCWFMPGNSSWEQGQFYIPLFVASAICLATCVFAMCQASQLSAIIESTEPAQTNPRLFAQRAIYVRLGVQLLALVIIFMPDAVVYYLSINSIDISTTVFSATTFIWKCESWIVALLWYSNARVREGILRIPFVHRLRVCCCGLPHEEFQDSTASSTARGRSRTRGATRELAVTISSPASHAALSVSAANQA